MQSTYWNLESVKKPRNWDRLIKVSEHVNWWSQSYLECRRNFLPSTRTIWKAFFSSCSLFLIAYVWNTENHSVSFWSNRREFQKVPLKKSSLHLWSTCKEFLSPNTSFKNFRFSFKIQIHSILVFFQRAIHSKILYGEGSLNLGVISSSVRARTWIQRIPVLD